ncbi:MAG: restriction endonuclease [Chlorobi bacterium]|nr:restriction endonuclease [Chlorobiota bacterium]
MDEIDKIERKREFLMQLQSLAKNLNKYLSTKDDQWVIKGFIDVYKNIFALSTDTKLISKVIELHLIPKLLEFANNYGYEVIFAEKQNWYPDITFVSKQDKKVKFAVDLKTTYVTKYKGGKPYECKGFTLGSRGTYFIDRKSEKNIQFPYGEYLGHYVLGILYERNAIDKTVRTQKFRSENLDKIPSVIKNFIVFAQEKWRIASDKSGSGNTANIGSVKKVEELLEGKGIFWKYFCEDGEKWFDEYWMNYGKVTLYDERTKKTKTVTSLDDFLKFKGIEPEELKTKRCDD